jgi:hypothetical protein
MSKACDTCAYFAPTGTDTRNNPDGSSGLVEYGQCRIGPPEVTDSTNAGRWPLVWADEWCGCHHPKGSPTLDEQVAELFDVDDGGGVVLPPSCGCARDDKPDVLPIPPREKPPGGGAA